jgi:hypothetical protein
MQKKLFQLAVAALIYASFLITGCGYQKENPKNSVQDPATEIKATPPAEAPEPLTVESNKFNIGNNDNLYFKMVDSTTTDIEFGANGEIEVTAEFQVLRTYTGSAQRAWVSLVALDSRGKVIKLSALPTGEMKSDDKDGSDFIEFMRNKPGFKGEMDFTGSVFKNGTSTIDVDATREAALKIVAFNVITSYSDIPEKD